MTALGTLSCEDECIGHGAPCRSAGLRLAPDPSEGSLVAQRADAADEADALRLRRLPGVLHVDPDDHSALILATLLLPAVRLVHVRTLAAARDMLANEQFSLIVLDPALPDGDGTELFEALRRRAATTPVLLYSAHHTVWRDQASAFLLKPWATPRQLLGTLERLLGRTLLGAVND